MMQMRSSGVDFFAEEVDKLDTGRRSMGESGQVGIPEVEQNSKAKEQFYNPRVTPSVKPKAQLVNPKMGLDRPNRGETMGEHKSRSTQKIRCNTPQGKATQAGRKRAEKRFGVRVSLLYFLMVGLMFVLGQGYEIVVYTIAVVLHELAHAEVAERLGYTLSRLKLMPYGASLTGNFEGAKARDELLIAAAGPLFNLLIAIPAVAMWWLVPESYYITKLFVSANIFIAAFNLLPVFPLDGGRILLAFFSARAPRQRVYRVIRVFGYIFAGVMAGLFVLSLFFGVNFSFALVAVFIFVSSVMPDKSSYYQRLYSMAYQSDRIRRGLPIREVMVGSDCTVLRLTRLLSGGHYTRFVVVGADLKPIAVITETTLEELSLVISPTEKIVESKNFTAFALHK